MEILKCEEVVKAVGGTLISGEVNTVFYNISTDSRNIKQGDLFIPLIGERFDGHNYIASALEHGALGSLTQKETEPFPGKVLIKVSDTLKALRDLAVYYRQKFKIPFVGITGSVGKTSTKEMVAAVLSKGFKVLKNQGNFNNEIGVPLTIFNLDKSHEAAVVEMGMSGFGEISRLTSIVKPDIAIITNIGVSHIEKLGSKNNILKAKMEIFEGLNEKGLAILNGDDKLLYGLNNLLKFRTVFYGMEEGLDLRAYNVESLGEKGSTFDIEIRGKEYRVRIPVPGIHNVYNALAGIAVGIELGIPPEKIVEGIEEFSPGKMRLDIINYNGLKIINDAYNASPQSMEAAIDVLKDISGEGRTFAVLGDMLELGEFSKSAHMEVGKYAASKGIDYIVAVGEYRSNIVRGAVEAGAKEEKVFEFKDNMDAAKFLKEFVKSGDVLLVKGSRGMKMEEIVNILTG
ncbi:MAG TPA: UDP-N-acetylmuramoyl-tripeptide--D-alanyl-D-alanine ligase [Hungateiclostridium thermocellum]|jgi:UDP-N-acetylmuramoyl-tripeptide--D-alanyl-D-alanine ligase|uniref:UDP-N-acetylmuramoyl-tripeptide--D-alanyl-D-alanine ligase n=2 Tax=Acetivibrio thermocellus TaxID=1515 RepID=A3DE30_ACET2|nr:UDP-N-acetylmuramoyl-tripeptide--D-alanyl-D-alanine ligase [Acetivibrio thermocellus]ABN52209.1 UDP-N-acetylmuramoylalanyl-D-glutamyl-2,6-diaminopimelate/D-alanyl-D-alanyl ligase [Acetivibrio thermocellus ATCC 27405]ADU74305.1 UDP-N-acetylmuramoylalanyl-D-glutamyl-2,6-diaminopimelate/D-alanyl-D-alanyl ligase [Acetivibrio thermocellus DSM 1313]ALX08247.1 UDP-N-acetylmuramoylalanyl-D-glutamyl-2,6-diaminopimelate/D-alanyl-D-alanyl ligase [Acetivibrio thermocellus AD2]ANV75995.1 UDP-N-acetylmura